MILLIDNFDSFTGNILDYALQCGLDCELQRSDALSMETIRKMDPEGIILSPGPKRPADHPLMLEVLEEYHSSKPILGVCLGHQAIGEFFGGRLHKADVPAHGKSCEIFHEGHAMFSGISSPLKVGRYHSLIISHLEDSPLIVTAHNREGMIMALAHKDLPLWGMQFHPESVLTEHGLQMLRNWAALLL